MSARLTALQQAGALSAIDVELSRSLSRLSGEQDEDVLLAVALASRQVQLGHVCADLPRLAESALLSPFEADSGQAPRCPPLAPWLERLHRSPLVDLHAADLGARPLVLDGRGRLYLTRYFDHERCVAQRLRALAAESLPVPLLEPSSLTRLFGGPAERDLQQQAAIASRGRGLSVIVGGPGTGKTSTVVKLLALLVEDALTTGRPPPRVLLLAPTGKAAQRLSEAVGSACARLATSEQVKACLPTQALTIHRALGPIAGSTTHFHRHAGSPLDHDLVLLDEASMVDLALMRRLLEALPQGARLIMLGDPDQLASVEAGGVLVDICAAAERGGPMAQAVSRLTKSYRYPEGSGIAALARAVHDGQQDEARRVLQAGLEDACLRPPPAERNPSRALTELARLGYRGLKAATLEERLAALSAFRVLCAHRQGGAGVTQLNPVLARAVHGAGRALAENHPGRPILITRNDYATGLFNGDVGVLHREQRAREIKAYFLDERGAPRPIAMARVPSHESVYAMTIHKSQGSEFDHVAIVLPERASPILSRELLYTAITRARRGVTLFASQAALELAITTRSARSSGLADRLV